MTSYTWPMIDWDELRQKRRERFVTLMKEKGLDHVLVSGFDNIRWITDYRTNFTYDSNLDWFAALVDLDGNSIFFTPEISNDEDDPFPEFSWIIRRVATPSWQSLWIHKSVYARLLARELKNSDARRVGVELLHFEVLDALRQELPNIDFIPVAWDLLELRKVKMPEEVRLIEAACDVGSMSVSAAIERTHEGITDSDVATLAVETAYRHGVEWVSHALVVANRTLGKESFYAKGERLWEGHSFLLDFGCYGVGGYCHDFCRTHFIGQPPPEVAQAYSSLVDAFEIGIEMAKPGVRCSEIAERINRALRMQNLPETPYGMGHGIGLRLIELPAIYHRVDLLERDDVLTEGMVICIEPSTDVETGDGQVVKLKEEDEFVVEANGLRRLTKSRRTQA